MDNVKEKFRRPGYLLGRPSALLTNRFVELYPAPRGRRAQTDLRVHVYFINSPRRRARKWPLPNSITRCTTQRARRSQTTGGNKLETSSSGWQNVLSANFPETNFPAQSRALVGLSRYVQIFILHTDTRTQ